MGKRKEEPLPRDEEMPPEEPAPDMAKESGITAPAPPAQPDRLRVRWAGPGSIAIGGVGAIEPGEKFWVSNDTARDLVRAPGFELVEE